MVDDGVLPERAANFNENNSYHIVASFNGLRSLSLGFDFVWDIYTHGEERSAGRAGRFMGGAMGVRPGGRWRRPFTELMSNKNIRVQQVYAAARQTIELEMRDAVSCSEGSSCNLKFGIPTVPGLALFLHFIKLSMTYKKHCIFCIMSIWCQSDFTFRGLISMKKYLAMATTVLALFTSSAFADSTVCKFYPHWDCSDPTQLQTLNQLEAFIAAHSVNGKGNGITAFDWDGTLYDEHIPNPNVGGETRSGQSLWHIWGADHLKQYPYLFPAFNSDNNIVDQANSILSKDSYVEGKLFQPVSPTETNPLSPSGYDKFSQIATFENGMTLQQMRDGMQAYLGDVKPTQYAFTRMLDIMQRMQDKGFVVYLVSGSSPYYLANLFSGPNGLNNTLGYTLLPGCADTTSDPQTFDSNCPIAGNGAKVRTLNATNYGFTGVYDDRFVRDSIRPVDRVIVDRYGKQLFLQQLAKSRNLPVVFYAGNSDGDTYAMTYTLNNSKDSMGIFVQPTLSKSTTFLQLLHSSLCDGRCVDVENP